MKQQGKQVVWPANLDSSKSRKHGRKLAKAVSVQAPRLEEIEDAAKRLSLEAEIVPRNLVQAPGGRKEDMQSSIRAMLGRVFFVL